MKNRLPLILNILLVLVALATMFYGAYMLRNLQNSLSTLEQRKPDLEFILLKDIALSVIYLEDEASSFRFSREQTHFQNIEETTEEVEYLLDSLQQLNKEDTILVRTADSLKSIFNRYSGVLKDYAEVSSKEVDPNFEKIQRVVQKDEREILEEQIEPDSTDFDSLMVEGDEQAVEEEKVGFFKRLFGKKQDEKEKDILAADSTDAGSLDTLEASQLPVDQEAYYGDLENVIDRLKAEYSSRTRATLERESELAKQLNRLQLLIYEYLTFIESREVTKTKLEAVAAESQLAETRKQVSQFSFVTGSLVFVVFVGLIIFLQQNQRFQRVLMLARRRAEEYARSKQLFLANMSHEIRTPMNAIVGFTEQLRKSELTPQQYEKIDIIHHSSDHLLHLLNDILDLSKFQTNTITLDNRRFDIRNLIRETIQLMEIKATQKGLQLIEDSTEVYYQYLVGDPYRLKQIMINLLSNAIKFTKEGSVKLAVSVHQLKKNNAELMIVVSDTGVGIPEDKRRTVFNAFEQLDTDEKTSGSGLGLSIVKHIVNLGGGAIDLRSELNQGTKVRVTFPIQISEEESDGKPANEPGALEMLDGTRILIADDEPFNRKLLSEIVKPTNAEIIFAEDGQQALDRLHEYDVDLAFLDIKMPRMQGHEVVRNYKSTARDKSKLKFIAVTATTEDDQIDLSDFDGMIRKPYREDDVFMVLNKYYAPNKLSENGKKILSIDSLASIGDEAFVKEMLETFVSSTEKHLEELADLRQDGKNSEIAALLHKIVGPARHMEAGRFLLILKKMEDKAREEMEISSEDLRNLSAEFGIVRQEVEKHLKENE